MSLAAAAAMVCPTHFPDRTPQVSDVANAACIVYRARRAWVPVRRGGVGVEAGNAGNWRRRTVSVRGVIDVLSARDERPFVG